MTPSDADPKVGLASPDWQEVAPGAKHEQLEDWIPPLAADDELRSALEKAFDYRGDVTITCKNGTRVEGYVFDRNTGSTLDQCFVRILTKTPARKLKILYTDIAGLDFSGRDTAAGKSWEAWLRKYWERRSAGDTDIALHPENLD
jgi:hypothetical protein